MASEYDRLVETSSVYFMIKELPLADIEGVYQKGERLHVTEDLQRGEVALLYFANCGFFEKYSCKSLVADGLIS